MIVPRHLAGMALAGVWATGACQPLERTRGFGEGELHLRVVADGAAVDGAIVEVVGAPRMARSDVEGRAVVPSLVAADYVVRVGVDDDGDLLPDRGAIRSGITIREAVVAGRPRLTTVDVGDVTLEPLGRITGVVSGVEDGELARVVAVRQVAIGEAAAARDVLLPIEGSAGVDTDGAFAIERLVPGTVTLVAMVWPRPTSTAPLQQLIAASRPVRVDQATAEVGGPAVAITMTTPAPASVSTTIELAGALGADRIGGLATFPVPTTSTDVSATLSARFDGLLAPAVLLADVPASLFDLNVQLDTGEAGRVALVTPLSGAALLPVPVGLTDCNLLDDAGDCDGDGLVASEDADDDGDGVDDLREPPGCVGVGRGIDDDGDCLCGLADPFPGCAANDPVDCTPAAPITCD